LSGIGGMSMRGSMRDVGEIRTCNIVKRGDDWFASIVVRGEFDRGCGTEACGLDWGVTTFATIATSQGELIEIENPRHGRRTAEKLAKAQRELARKKRGSSRRGKAKQKVRRLHEKLKMQRHDFLHQTSNRLVNQFGMIATEQLAVSNMVRSAAGTVEEPGKMVAQKAGLNREILDTAPSAFLAMVAYKAACAGGMLVEINTRKHKPSQTCPVSGEVVKKKLSQRTHTLPDGSVIGRDHAAAMVILSVALSQHGREPANAA
jgi:putative transposase